MIEMLMLELRVGRLSRYLVGRVDGSRWDMESGLRVIKV